MKTRHHKYNDYEVHSEGYVVSYKNPNKPVKLKPQNTTGNRQFRIDRRMVLVQRFIWEAFNGEIPKDHIIYFKDGDNQNYNLNNLGIRSKSEHQRLTISKRYA